MSVSQLSQPDLNRGHLLDEFELLPSDKVSDPVENLVFEGGGVKGSAYVGVIEVLAEKSVLAGAKRVAGSSAGGIVALMLALGMSAEEIRAEMDSMEFSKFQDYPNQTWSEFLGVPGRIGGHFRSLEQTLVGLLSNQRGPYQGDYFTAWAEKLIARKLGKPNATFRDLHEQMKTNPALKEAVFTGTAIAGPDSPSLFHFRYDENHPEFNDMPLSTAVRITMSFPGAFGVVKYGNRYYVDGGVASNFPMHIFDDQRYIVGNQRTSQGKNPRTLGFKIDGLEEWSIEVDVVQKAVDAGYLKDRDQVMTQEIYEKTVDLLSKKGEINDQEKAALLSADLREKLTGKQFLANLVGGMLDDRRKVAEYKGQVAQIYDEGVATLDFALSKENKDKLIQSGRMATRALLAGRSQFSVERYEQNLRELSSRVDGFIKGGDLEGVAIAYHLLQESLDRLSKEMAMEGIDKKRWEIGESMIKLTHEALSEMRNKISPEQAPDFRKKYPDGLGSPETPEIIKKYQERIFSKSIPSSERDLNISTEERAWIRTEQVLAQAKENLDFHQTLRSSLDADLKPSAEMQARLAERLRDKADPISDQFWSTLKALHHLKSEENLLKQEIQKLVPGAEGWKALEKKEKELQNERVQLTEYFREYLLKLDESHLPAKDRKCLEDWFSLAVASDWHDLPDLEKHVSHLKSDLEQLQSDMDKQQTMLEKTIQMANQQLEDYGLRPERSRFFSELVDLKWFLEEMITKNRSKATDYLRYGCEQVWGFGHLFRWAFGDVATQKHLLEQEALTLKAVVEETYQALRHKKTDGSQLDDSILAMLAANIRFAQRDLNKQFLHELNHWQPLGAVRPSFLISPASKLAPELPETAPGPEAAPPGPSLNSPKPQS